MPGEISQVISSEHVFRNDARVEHFEHYSFTWSLKRFTRQWLLMVNPQSLGTVTFLDSESSVFSTSWNIEIHSFQRETDGTCIEMSLTRLDSKYKSPVFAKFCAVIQSKRKCVIRNIHSNYSIGDTISRILLKMKSISDIELYQSLDKKLIILCEMALYKQEEENISHQIHERFPQVQAAILSDIDNRIQCEINSNMFSVVHSEVALCFKVVLIPKVCVLTDWIYDRENCIFHANTYKSKTFYAFLENFYCEFMKFYVDRTMQNKLNEPTGSFKILSLQNLIQYICSQNTAVARLINVTLEIPQFKKLCSQSTSLYYPGKESGVFFDNKWQLELKFSRNQNQVSMYVHRTTDEKSVDAVKLTVNVILKGKVVLKRSDFLNFELENTQGFNNFMTRNELCNLLSEKTLVLNCSLEVINSYQLLESYIKEWIVLSRYHSDFLEMAIDSFQRRGVRILSDIKKIFIHFLLTVKHVDFVTTDRICPKVFENINQHFRIHSCALSVRTLTQIFSIFSCREFVQSLLFCTEPARFTYCVKKKNRKDFAVNVLDNGRIYNSIKNPEMFQIKQTMFKIILGTLPRSIILEGLASVKRRERYPIAENEGQSQHSSPSDNEVPGERRNSSESSEISDHNSTFEADEEVHAVTEYQPVLHPSSTQGNFQTSILKDGEIYSAIGSNDICYPQVINESQFAPNNTPHSNVSFDQAHSSEETGDNIIVEQYSEESEETSNALCLHNPQTNFGNESNSLHLSNERFMPVIATEYSGTVYFSTNDLSGFVSTHLNQPVHPETNAAFFHNLHTNLEISTEFNPEFGCNHYSDIHVDMMNQHLYQHSTADVLHLPSSVLPNFTNTNYAYSTSETYNQDSFINVNQETAYPPPYTENISHIHPSTSQAYPSFQDSYTEYAYHPLSSSQVPLHNPNHDVVNYRSMQFFEVTDAYYTAPACETQYESNQLVSYPYTENVSHVQDCRTASFSAQSNHPDIPGHYPFFSHQPTYFQPNTNTESTSLQRDLYLGPLGPEIEAHGTTIDVNQSTYEPVSISDSENTNNQLKNEE